jgi:hypothetical protein
MMMSEDLCANSWYLSTTLLRHRALLQSSRSEYIYMTIIVVNGLEAFHYYDYITVILMLA